MAAAVASEKKFEITVIATSAKVVATHAREKIGALKREALRAFGIPQSGADEYRLATSPGNPQSELDDKVTVSEAGLHEGSKVYLTKPHNDA